MRSIVVGLLVLLSVSVMLAGCSTINQTLTAATKRVSGAQFCSVAEPITYSRKDTVDTQKQVREHNAVWDELCKKK